MVDSKSMHMFKADIGLCSFELDFSTDMVVELGDLNDSFQLCNSTILWYYINANAGMYIDMHAHNISSVVIHKVKKIATPAVKQGWFNEMEAIFILEGNMWDQSHLSSFN